MDKHQRVSKLSRKFLLPFSKGDHSDRKECTFLEHESFIKETVLNGKRLLPEGANSLFKESLSPLEKLGKYFLDSDLT